MKKYALFLLPVLIACNHKTNGVNLHISLTDSSRSLKFTGLDAAIAGEIGRDSSTAIWQSLIPVYRMPADTDMKDFQKPQPGKYSIAGNAVVFTPDTPFAKHQAYFVRLYRFGEGNKALDYIKGDKKLGKPPYTDLIFKR